MATKRYEFQPPTNIDAIRSSIIQRLKKRTSNSAAPLTPPPSESDEYDKKLPFTHLDNGLPSPPIETCCFEEESLPPTEMVVNALIELEPKKKKQEESSEVIRERIRLLKEEKHKLFQAMKELLSTPPPPPPPLTPSIFPTPTPPSQQQQQQQQQQQPSLATKPVIVRSRSISHSESRPISRYYDRPRYYNNNYYPYQPTSISSSSTSRRVINNNNSSYVSSRPQSSSSSFRPDRY
ncbi:hypothetical protein BD770DRAFT_406538 [Pilaira anomala]|nr:hypothetical protein BD770DRAFT_406538 [Pilaira anomala]